MNDDLNKTKEEDKHNLSNHTTSRMEVSIVIPAYNEEESIADQIKEVHSVMEQTDWTYEVIVVNDDSTDGTAKQVEKQKAKLHNLPRNRGYGTALKAGIKEARSECIVTIDADGTYPCTAIPSTQNKT